MKRGTYTHARIPTGYLAAALLVLLAGCLLLYATRRDAQTAFYDTQLRAARRMAQAEAYLKGVVEKEQIPMEGDDLNQTGLIGPEWTELTTSLGHLEAKRSSLNPNMAALVVRYLHDAGIRAGDTVAVGSSGSFPGLAIAALCAATEMGLDTRVIASFGSSMYGGTRRALPTVRMLQLLEDAGIIRMDLMAVSPGGDDDRGENLLYEDGRSIILGLAAQTGVPVIDAPSLKDSIARRIALYGDIRLFINVGGASANMGESAYTLTFPNGLVLDPPPIPHDENRGLMFEYAARGLPVIHLLNVRKLCLDNGLPFDPVPLPAPGEGGVYRRTAYRLPVAAAALGLGAALLALGARSDRRKVALDRAKWAGAA